MSVNLRMDLNKEKEQLNFLMVIYTMVNFQMIKEVVLVFQKKITEIDMKGNG